MVGTPETEADEATIRGIFEFAEGDCLLSVEEQVEEPVAAPAAPDEQSVPVILPTATVVSLVPPQSPPAASPVEVLPKEAASPAAKATSMQPTIRVDLDRVDRLINLVGELVINQAMLSQRVKQSSHVRDAGVATSLDELEHLTRDIQESVMAIRAQPVKPLFQRMSRIVREVADATGKAVRLRTDGEATEVDKTVLELLADPLTHMIRNAVDHGIEKPEDRDRCGQAGGGRHPAVGGASLGPRRDRGVGRWRRHQPAAHPAIGDPQGPGAGGCPAERGRDRQPAVPAGLLDGLDGLQHLGPRRRHGCRQARHPEPRRPHHHLIAAGQGSTFTMSLPLTLAVLDGIVVSIGSQSFVIPLTAIVETLKIEPQALHSMGEGTLSSTSAAASCR